MPISCATYWKVHPLRAARRFAWVTLACGSKPRSLGMVTPQNLNMRPWAARVTRPGLLVARPMPAVFGAAVGVVQERRAQAGARAAGAAEKLIDEELRTERLTASLRARAAARAAAAAEEEAEAAETEKLLGRPLKPKGKTSTNEPVAAAAPADAPPIGTAPGGGRLQRGSLQIRCSAPRTCDWQRTKQPSPSRPPRDCGSATQPSRSCTRCSPSSPVAGTWWCRRAANC